MVLHPNRPQVEQVKQVVNICQYFAVYDMCCTSDNENYSPNCITRHMLIPFLHVERSPSRLICTLSLKYKYKPMSVKSFTGINVNRNSHGFILIP